MTYDNSNQAILKKVASENPKAPTLRLEIDIEGKKYKAGLWEWTKKDGTPVTDKAGNKQYIGAVEVDTYGEKSEGTVQQAVAPDFDLDQSIPFSNYEYRTLA